MFGIQVQTRSNIWLYFIACRASKWEIWDLVYSSKDQKATREKVLAFTCHVREKVWTRGKNLMCCAPSFFLVWVIPNYTTRANFPCHTTMKVTAQIPPSVLYFYEINRTFQTTCTMQSCGPVRICFIWSTSLYMTQECKLVSLHMSSVHKIDTRLGPIVYFVTSWYIVLKQVCSKILLIFNNYLLKCWCMQGQLTRKKPLRSVLRLP